VAAMAGTWRAVAAVAGLLAATTGAAGCVPAGPSSGSAYQAPPVMVLTHGADNGNGDIFLTPTGGGYPSGPEILSRTGKVIWFRSLPPGEAATDFRTQTYRGRPVLTWCQLSGQGKRAKWTDYIFNDRYQRIARVRAGNGYATDYHEFLITPWNTALVTATRLVTVRLRSASRPVSQKVIDDVVQEIDIGTGKVLFQWNTIGHVPLRDSELPRPASPATPWDWFHINAVHLDTDGNLLINSRYTWTTYKVSRRTGTIIWELGGKQSTFTLRAGPGQVLDRAGEIFAFQHDPEAIGNGEYTFFDDEAAETRSLLPYSRAVTVRLDLATRVATLIRSVNQPERLLARAQGNAQITRNGDMFVDWGVLPYFSEFSPAGRLLLNVEFPPGVSSYRAYRLPWHPG
jgi:arylsulfotransferase ASST